MASVVQETAGVPVAGAAPRAAAVARLSLTDFRCYARLRLDLDPAPVVLTGPNGAGKTNLLEALSFLAPGRGLRRARLAELDRRPASRSDARDTDAVAPWAISAVLDTAQGRVHIGTGRDGGEGEKASERRLVRIDGHATRGQKDLAEHVAIVWLTPELDRLFLDGSSGRRRFVDRVVYGFQPGHAGEVSAYETVMRERTRLLSEGSADAAWLDALEDGMARHGVAIAAARADVVRRLDAAAARPGPFPTARLALVGAVDTALTERPAVAVEDAARAALKAARGHDALHGGAAWGPHRTDLAVRYAAKDCPARDCSTGEQKALLLSITLAVARELASERGEAPLLLLDEVVAHLDGARRAALFDEISALGAQAWLTGTDDELFHGLRGRASFFRVLDATVMPR